MSGTAAAMENAAMENVAMENESHLPTSRWSASLRAVVASALHAATGNFRRDRRQSGALLQDSFISASEAETSLDGAEQPWMLVDVTRSAQEEKTCARWAAADDSDGRRAAAADQ